MTQRFPYRSIKITKEGIFYILASIVIGFSAFNSGNNLIYFIFAFLLSLLGASSIIAVNNLKGIYVKITSKDEIYANSESFFQLEVINKESSKKFLLKVKVLGNTYKISNLNNKFEKNIKVFEQKRGIKKIDKVLISSSYPFSFFEREKEISLNFSYYVFPEIREVYIKDAKVSGHKSIKKSEDGDYYSISDYTEGMDARKISWKISAKVEKEKIIESGESSDENIKIVFDNSSKLYDSDSFEDAVVKVASLVYTFYKNRVIFEFVSPSVNTKCTTYEDYIRIMEYLSTVQLEEKEPILNDYDGITPNEIFFI